jgi:hypothetical protein
VKLAFVLVVYAVALARIRYAASSPGRPSGSARRSCAYLSMASRWDNIVEYVMSIERALASGGLGVRGG